MNENEIDDDMKQLLDRAWIIHDKVFSEDDGDYVANVVAIAHLMIAYEQHIFKSHEGARR